MSKDEGRLEMSSEQFERRREELLDEFCKERGIDPKKIDAIQLSIFYETSEMQALFARKHKRPRD
jgi:chorismate mutase